MPSIQPDLKRALLRVLPQHFDHVTSLLPSIEWPQQHPQLLFRKMSLFLSECEEHNSLGPMVFMEGLCSEQGYLDPVLVSPPAKKKPLENKPGRQDEFQMHGNPDDSSVLRKDIRDLKAQLQNANKVIQNLRSRVRSLSATSDYSSSLERPRKLRTIATLEGSSPHSVTDEDEGWLSDGTGAFYPPGLQAKKDLESLIQRVSQLEAQLPKTGLEGKLAEELRSASWPG